MDGQANYDAIAKNEPCVERIREFINDLPADLRLDGSARPRFTGFPGRNAPIGEAR